MARRILNPVLLDPFKVVPLEFVIKESTDRVLEKVSFWLKLESRVEELLPRIGPWQGTMLLFLYAAFFGGPFTDAWSLATFVGERNSSTLADLRRVASGHEFALESRGKRIAGSCLVQPSALRCMQPASGSLLCQREQKRPESMFNVMCIKEEYLALFVIISVITAAEYQLTDIFYL